MRTHSIRTVHVSIPSPMPPTTADILERELRRGHAVAVYQFGADGLIAIGRPGRPRPWHLVGTSARYRSAVGMLLAHFAVDA